MASSAFLETSLALGRAGKGHCCVLCHWVTIQGATTKGLWIFSVLGPGNLLSLICLLLLTQGLHSSPNVIISTVPVYSHLSLEQACGERRLHRGGQWQLA